MWTEGVPRPPRLLRERALHTAGKRGRVQKQSDGSTGLWPDASLGQHRWLEGRCRQSQMMNIGDRCPDTLVTHTALRLPSSLRRYSARRSLRLLKSKRRPARPVKEPSVPALHPARKHNMKKGRRQGRARVTGPTKAAWRILRTKTTLVPGPVPWLLLR
jgi:hypothetical protein